MIGGETMAKYFHISRDIDKDIKIFVPRSVSQFSGSILGEDTSTKRVSICENIHECLNGLSYSHDEEAYDKVSGRFRLLKVYEFELDPGDVVPYTDLTGKVPDALQTKECWSIKEIEPVNSYIIELTYFHVEDKYPYLIRDVEYEILNE